MVDKYDYPCVMRHTSGIVDNWSWRACTSHIVDKYSGHVGVATVTVKVAGCAGGVVLLHCSIISAYVYDIVAHPWHPGPCHRAVP